MAKLHRLPLVLVIAFLGMVTGGCTTYFKVLSAQVESVVEPNVVLIVETDMDLEDAKWKKHNVRLDFVLLDMARLDRIRAVRPEVPSTLEDGGPFLMADFGERFAVFAWWHQSPEEIQPLLTRNGGIESGTRVEGNRWRYRISIPFRQIRHVGHSPEDGPISYDRPDAYDLTRGVFYCWGSLVGARFLGYPQFESDVFFVRVRIP